ncbi:MAG: Lrp/AsnC family transcriptional regulator [Promethearchaeota archaeon]|nr:MAG: Lrp/AsnC family transcriptional regulator [Candidatus Lokiarchaeota archaeon]
MTIIKAVMFCKLGISVINKVIEELKKIEQIKKIMSLTGDYDLLAEIEVETSEELFDIFANQIDLINGIVQSNTHLIMKSWEK